MQRTTDVAVARDPGELGELDATTLALAKAGDPQALTALVRRYERRLYALVWRLLAGRPDLVPDAAQESFLKVLRALPRFESGPQARLSTWMLTIATRTCLDLLRGRERGERVAELPASAASPEDGAADRQLGRAVEAAMARLPEEMRAVLVLRAYHDFDYDEIGAALGLAVGTVKSRLARAREALRAAFREQP